MSLPPSKPDYVLRNPPTLPPAAPKRNTAERQALIDRVRLETRYDPLSCTYVWTVTIPDQVMFEASYGARLHLARPVVDLSDELVNLANFLFALELEKEKSSDAER